MASISADRKRELKELAKGRGRVSSRPTPETHAPKQTAPPEKSKRTFGGERTSLIDEITNASSLEAAREAFEAFNNFEGKPLVSEQEFTRITKTKTSTPVDDPATTKDADDIHLNPLSVPEKPAPQKKRPKATTPRKPKAKKVTPEVAETTPVVEAAEQAETPVVPSMDKPTESTVSKKETGGGDFVKFLLDFNAAVQKQWRKEHPASPQTTTTPFVLTKEQRKGRRRGFRGKNEDGEKGKRGRPQQRNKNRKEGEGDSEKEEHRGFKPTIRMVLLKARIEELTFDAAFRWEMICMRKYANKSTLEELKNLQEVFQQRGTAQNALAREEIAARAAALVAKNETKNGSPTVKQTAEKKSRPIGNHPRVVTARHRELARAIATLLEEWGDRCAAGDLPSEVFEVKRKTACLIAAGNGNINETVMDAVADGTLEVFESDNIFRALAPFRVKRTEKSRLAMSR